MRIAAIIPGVPEPADRGTHKRYRAWVNALSGLGQVDLCCLADAGSDPAGVLRLASRVRHLQITPVRLQPWRPLTAQLLDPLPPNVRHWFDPDAARQVADFFAGRSFDRVLLGDLVSIPYAEAAGLAGDASLLDRGRVDVEFQRQRDGLAPAASWPRRMAQALRRDRTAAYERHAAAVVGGQVVCAASDAQALRSCIGSACPIHLVANGIEAEEFPDLGGLSEDPAVMMAGAMDYLPNVDGALWYVREAWPLVRSRLPGATLTIVGRDPVQAIRALHGQDGIVVTGQVESMLPSYRAARAVVAPIRIGGGTRLKVVECWSVGRPLVATRIAVDGLDAVHGRDALLADDGHGIAAATVQALGPAADQLRAGALRAAGRYGWDRLFAPLLSTWAGARAA